MEILNETQVHDMFFECLYTDYYIETLNNYQLEKIYIYALDYEHNLKPTYREHIEHFKKTKKHLERNPMRENVNELIKKIKEKLSFKPTDKIYHEENYYKLMAGNIHVIDSMTLAQIFEIRKFAERQVIEISLFGPKKEHLKPEEFFNTNLEYKSAKQTFDLIDNYYNEKSKNIEQKEKLNDYELNEDQEKILFLEKIGVVDFLRTKYKLSSNGRIGEILKPVTNVKSDTTAKTLGRIYKNALSDKTNTVIFNLINKLKLKIDK